VRSPQGGVPDPPQRWGCARGVLNQVRAFCPLGAPGGLCPNQACQDAQICTSPAVFPDATAGVGPVVFGSQCRPATRPHIPHHTSRTDITLQSADERPWNVGYSHQADQVVVSLHLSCQGVLPKPAAPPSDVIFHDRPDTPRSRPMDATGRPRYYRTWSQPAACQQQDASHAGTWHPPVSDQT
jgi:hypothetical protein